MNKVNFSKIENYQNGWFLGAFHPTMFFTKDFEVAIFYIKKGTKSDKHYHKICDEYNVIVDGECTIVSEGIKHDLTKGDIFHFEKGVKTDVEYTQDTSLVVIKVPSHPGDKHW